MKAMGRFISTLIVIDTFLASYFFGFHSRSVPVIDPTMKPLAPPVVKKEEPKKEASPKPVEKAATGKKAEKPAKTQATAHGKKAHTKASTAAPAEKKAKPKTKE